MTVAIPVDKRKVVFMRGDVSLTEGHATAYRYLVGRVAT